MSREINNVKDSVNTAVILAKMGLKPHLCTTTFIMMFAVKRTCSFKVKQGWCPVIRAPLTNKEVNNPALSAFFLNGIIKLVSFYQYDNEYA